MQPNQSSAVDGRHRTKLNTRGKMFRLCVPQRHNACRFNSRQGQSSGLGMPNLIIAASLRTLPPQRRPPSTKRQATRSVHSNLTCELHIARLRKNLMYSRTAYLHSFGTIFGLVPSGRHFHTGPVGGVEEMEQFSICLEMSDERHSERHSHRPRAIMALDGAARFDRQYVIVSLKYDRRLENTSLPGPVVQLGRRRPRLRCSGDIVVRIPFS